MKKAKNIKNVSIWYIHPVWWKPKYSLVGCESTTEQSTILCLPFKKTKTPEGSCRRNNNKSNIVSLIQRYMKIFPLLSKYLIPAQQLVGYVSRPPKKKKKIGQSDRSGVQLGKVINLFMLPKVQRLIGREGEPRPSSNHGIEEGV